MLCIVLSLPIFTVVSKLRILLWRERELKILSKFVKDDFMSSTARCIKPNITLINKFDPRERERMDTRGKIWKGRGKLFSREWIKWNHRPIKSTDRMECFLFHSNNAFPEYSEFYSSCSWKEPWTLGSIAYSHSLKSCFIT